MALPAFTARPPLAVVKLGGSVLTGPAAYRRAADFLNRRLARRWGRRFVAVASAQSGHTDRLLRQARRQQPCPDPAALDLLWSTGELRSVALLTLALRRRGVPARGLGVRECGLTAPEGGLSGSAFQEARLLRVEAAPLRRRLSRHPVLVVPGFLACTPSGAVVSLGRGGSDLTALLLAGALEADCELVKDVPGYFDRDPNRFPEARPLPRLTYQAALDMAGAGCRLVQRQALLAARRLGVPLVIRSLAPNAPSTIVAEASPLCGYHCGKTAPFPRGPQYSNFELEL